MAALGEHARAGTVEDAARAEVVMVAIPLHAIAELPDPALFDGKVVVDANNYYPGRDGQIAALDDDSTTSSELLAARLPGPAWSRRSTRSSPRACATTGTRELAADDRPAIPIVGDDEAAKATVTGLADELGFTAVDHGALAEGRAQQPGAEVYGAELTAREARAILV